MQPISVSIVETEQPITSKEILKFCGQSENSCLSESRRDVQERRLRRKSKVSTGTVDTEI